VFGLDQQVLCLDWDRRSLRFIVAKLLKGGRIRLSDAHQRRIPTNIDCEDPQPFGAFIGGVLKQHGLKFGKVVLDVPRDKAVINRLKLAPTPAAEVAAAVRFQALRELPFPLDEAQIDFVVVERDGSKLATEVLLAAVRNDTLERMKETCQAAGLTPARIGLRPYANLVSAMHLPAMLDRRVCFLDVGPTVTEIDVFRGNTLVFSRAATVGVPFDSGKLMADDSVVLSSKSEIARLDRSDDYQSSAVEELTVEITRSLQAYRAAEANATIDQFLVAGGTGVESALLAAIDERFGIPAMLFDPTTALGLTEDRASDLRAFTACLGLAWGASKPGSIEIDFLNPKRPVPRHETLKKQARVIGVAAALLVGAGVGYAGFDYYSLSTRYEDLHSLNEEPAKKARARRDLEITARAAEDWAREARERMWLEHLTVMTEKAIEIAGREPPTKKMLVTQLTCDGDGGRLTMKLACDDWDVAQKFVEAINATRIAGKQAYKATPQKWTESKSEDHKFKGTVQIDVDLLTLQALEAGAKAREEGYKKLRSQPL
jgi:type IV pilus assembly protein PilM